MTVAALDSNSKSSGGKGAVWGRHGGDRKDPDLEKITVLTYLVVDDSRFARAIAKNILHVLGIRNIIEAEDALQAFEVIDKHGVDVIVIDYEMPGMSGAEFTWRLRRSKNERLQQMPVIMVTNHVDEGRVRNAINSGVNEFLPKPFSQTAFYQRVRRSVVSPKPFIVAEGYIGPDRRLMNRDSDGQAARRGLPPVTVFDCTGEEPKRIEIGQDEIKNRFSVMTETVSPAAGPDGSGPDEGADAPRVDETPKP